MSASIHLFPGEDRSESDRLALFEQREADANALPVQFGTQEEWTFSAIDHLKIVSCERADGSVTISAAALHLALAHIDEIDAREVSGGGA